MECRRLAPDERRCDESLIDRHYLHLIALFYHLEILLHYGLARHREMGQKRMRNHGLEHEADSGGVYDSSLSLTVHWVLFKPTISGFYDIRSFGMGIGGVLDRPTDTLPHGVYGVDHVCGPFVLHVQTYGALRFYFEAVAYVHILWQRSILSLQGCTLRVRRRPEALRMVLRRIVLLVSHLRSSYVHLACPPGPGVGLVRVRHRRRREGEVQL
jgi:hypothetical protein